MKECDKNEVITEKKYRKFYSVETFVDQDNTLHLHRTNEGFGGNELLGVLEHIQLDILKQLSGEIKPDWVKRSIVESEKDLVKSPGKIKNKNGK